MNLSKIEIMIIKININIFNSDNQEVLDGLTSIFRTLFKPSCEHMWDTSNIDKDAIVLIKEEEWFTKYLSSNEQELFEKLIQKEEITEIKEFYFSRFSVETLQDLKNLNKILSEVSYVILENGTNDWKFVKGMVLKYSKVKRNQRKILYRKLKRCIETNQLRPDNAGGKDQIINQIKVKEELLGRNFIKFKIATIFDSDRTKFEDKDNINKSQKKIISYIKKEGVIDAKIQKYEISDLIPWHMLYKREAENYLPLDFLLRYFPLDNSDEIKSFSKEQYDFVDMESFFSSYDVKNEFPELFLKDELKRIDIEEQCKHHKIRIDIVGDKSEEISEIESLLTNLSRII